MMKSIFSLILISAIVSFSSQSTDMTGTLFSQPGPAKETVSSLPWPPVNRETKPWTRWWWPGSIVNEKDLAAALNKYAEAGLGGLELTVLYGVKGQEDKFINYLSPEWMKMFVFTLKEANRLNIGIDLANSSSWPFGGRWVTTDDASKYVAYKTWQLNEGEKLTEQVVYIQEPSIRFNGTARPDIATLKDPVYENEGLQTLAIDQIRFKKPIPLQLLMAYPEKGPALDLTDKVDDSGNLKWIAPAGKWTLYAIFQGWHGKMVERAGPGGEGYVIDHFSGKAIDNYLKYFDNAFKGYDISLLRGYFNDSYEVDDARGQSNWTPDLFSEFKTRRGYDLRQNLPALFQKDTPEKNAGVLSDYRQTISDLILEKFTSGWRGWANSQGKITRNQSHGSPANILDLYGASDIPETEGTDLLRMKFATSAANVTGKRYASAEAATWLGEHFSSTLLDVKKAVDQYFIAGVNHIVYHGTCYSPENEPWPGFQFYAAVEFTPANSIWYDFPALNKYVTRVQSFLQSSKPDNDILLYFPIFDRYSDYNNIMVEHFDAISPKYNGTPFKIAAEKMIEKGYQFDYISDKQINRILVSEGQLVTEGGSPYKTLILPGSKYIPLETFNKIINFADKGATVIILSNLPEDIAGWASIESKREMFRGLIENLRFTDTSDKGIKQANHGSGKIIIGNDLEKLLAFAGIGRETFVDNGLKFTRRKNGNTSYYFILNQTNTPYEGWITVQSKARDAAIYNPMTDIKGFAKTRISSTGNIEVFAKLLPAESIIARTFNTKQSGDRLIYFDTLSSPKELKGTWKIEFISGGPELPASKEITSLVSWTDFGGEAVKNFSGTVKYSISLNKPEGKADSWLLNLGKVYESASIILNGSELATLIGPDYQVVIEKRLLKSQNTLEIRVSNLAANRIAYLDRNNILWKKFYNTNFPARLPENRKNGLFDASAWLPGESGLIGPVTITALHKR